MREWCLLQFGLAAVKKGSGKSMELLGTQIASDFTITCKWWRKMAWLSGTGVGRSLIPAQALHVLRVYRYSPAPPATLTRIKQRWWEDGWTDIMPVFCIHTHIPSVWWMIMFGLRVSGITVVSIKCRAGPGVALRAENQKILSHKDWFPQKKSAQSFHGEY